MFFENFTSFQLFRKHDLLVKLERITAPAQAKALLAIMLAFATKSGGQIRTINTTTEADEPVSSSYFFDLALESLNIAIHECEDDSMSIPLLQALILITHWLLIKGVRSRAWRYLGIAIRSAYELNLHLIDAGRGSEDQNLDHNQWCEDEERRRAWWAIWEMDVFASVIRRCPTGIDWSQNEAFLPAEDTNWLIGKPQRSCPLELGLNRWKSLEATGNQSPKAWFIVLNSLMKDAQNISSPVGVDGTFTAASSQFAGESIKHHHERRKGTTVTTKVSLNRLSTVQNALHCTVMAIPTVWKYQGQSLDFGTKESNSQAASARKLLHSSIYSINMMTQLAKLMIYKYHVFPSGKVRTTMPANSNLVGGPDEDDASRKEPRGATSVQVDTQALQQYSEAADEIVSMIRKCFGEHYQYLNPFLSNTMWLAAAVQLLYRELAPPGSTDKNLVDSNFEVLRMTHNRFVSYGGMSATLQQNLAVVEHELEILQIRRKEKGIHPQTTGPTLRVSSDKRNRTREDDDRTLTVRVPGSERRMETLGDCGKYALDIHYVSPTNFLRKVPTPVPRAYSIKSHQDPPDPDPQIFTWLDINQRAQHNNFPALPDPGRQQLFNNHCGLYPPLRAPLLAQSSEQHERQQSQQLALGQPLMNTRLSDVENALSNPDSAAKQIATGPQSIQNSLLRETNQMPYPKGSDAQAPMSPDFLNGFSFSHDIPGPDIDLSSYLDDMLSGSYMT